MKVDRFCISLEKDIYFPGDIVRGSLYLQNSKEVKCRGVRVHVQGKSYCQFVVRRGNDTDTVKARRFYTNCKRTFLGNVHKTPVIYNAGNNAIYGPPWAPDEGILFVKIPVGESELILRAMDYQWCTKDKVLGETMIDINQAIDRGVVECPLMSKGQRLQGSIHLSMKWQGEEHADYNGMPVRLLVVQIYRAINLKSGSWFDTNDVYVQLYCKPRNAVIQANKALPEPDMTLIIPPGQITIPFEFQLPADLPSTMVHSNHCYVTYSIYANIDVAWKQDPSTRSFFTVIQPQPLKSLFTPATRQIMYNVSYLMCIPPLCCVGCDLYSIGPVTLVGKLARTGYAPGETIELTVEVNNATWPEFFTQIRQVKLELYNNITMHAEGCTHTINALVSQATGISLMSTVNTLTLRVPACSPGYRGGLGMDPNWLGGVARYGGQWAAPSPDPLKWDNFLQLTVLVDYPGISLDIQREFKLVVPVSIGPIGLQLVQQIAGGNQNTPHQPPPPQQQFQPQYQQPIQQPIQQPQYQQPQYQQPPQYQQAQQYQYNGLPHNLQASALPMDNMAHLRAGQSPDMQMQMAMGAMAMATAVAISNNHQANVVQGHVVAVTPPTNYPSYQQPTIQQQQQYQYQPQPQPQHHYQAPQQQYPQYAPSTHTESTATATYQPQPATSTTSNTTSTALPTQNQAIIRTNQVAPIPNQLDTSNIYGVDLSALNSSHWRDDQVIKQALPKLLLCETQDAPMNAQLIKDPEEDHLGNQQELMFKPKFFMNRS